MKKQNLVNRVMTRKIYIARVGIPVWATALGAVVIGATAGQAVGPILSGGVTGTIGLGVGGDGGVSISQSIVLAHESDQAHYISGGEDGVIAVSDDGTSFTIAVEAFENQPVDVNLDVQNDSGADAFAQMTCIGPSALTTIDIDELTSEDEHVDVDDEDGDTDVAELITGVQIARMGRDTWLMKVPSFEASGDADFALTLSGRAGFHTIRCAIKQISG